MDKTIDKKKIIGIVVGVIVATIVSSFIREYIFNEGNSIDQSLKSASEMTNKNCPIYLDSLTRLDNTIALPNKTFQYNNTVKIDTTVLSLNVLKANLKNSISNSIKTNPAMKEFRDNHVTVVYSYSDVNGNFLFKLEFTPQDYK